MNEEFAVNGELIRTLRNKFGWSGEEMASLVGIKPKYVYMIERNERTPTLPVLLKIAKVLCVPFSCLITLEEIYPQEGYFRSGQIELDVPAELVEPIIRLISSYKGVR